MPGGRPQHPPDEAPRAPLADASGRPLALGAALRRAWVGYQQMLDAEMAAAGFEARRLPDRRVLALCARTPEISSAQIARELDITRQAVRKLLAHLEARGYVTLAPSPADGREKTIILTQLANDYLAAHWTAARKIESLAYAEVGEAGLRALADVLGVLCGEEESPRLRDYLRHASRLEG